MTSSSNLILQHYIKLTEFLGKALGPDYEVALHDLTRKDRSIIAIANNYISGREVGAPLTNMALSSLRDKSYERMDYHLHYYSINGFLAAAVGFSLVLLLNDNEKLTFDLSPFFLAMVAFCFSMTIGVLWEFFEFGMDWFFHTDMQRDTVINAIYSASLDPTRTNKVVAVKEIHDVVINGENLGLGGYLDIGLIDTMKDLLVNFVGAVVFSVAGYFYARSKGKKRAAALNFVPSKKNEDHDYLQQARENGPDLPEKRKK